MAKPHQRSLPGDLIASAIASLGISIYEDLESQPELVYEVATLEARLDVGLRGLDLGYPLRTRAKVAKSAVVRILGYPVPRSFAKTRPRIPGQDLDVFVQKADNLQIWNEEISPRRRYVIIRVDDSERVSAVRVLTGEAIALLDQTGTLTSKFQARRRIGRTGSTLVTGIDTERFRQVLIPRGAAATRTIAGGSSLGRPRPGSVLPIAELHERLVAGLVGRSVRDPGLVQDRNRGIALQRLVCASLGITAYADMGQFPDIPSQALEVKLQLSPTIDLGLVTPDSTHVSQELGASIRHCDVRYAIAYAARLSPDEIRIEEVVTSTGEAFFREFQRFEGRVKNAKLQIPLPRRLFQSERPPHKPV